MSRFKTELCNNLIELGTCKYGDRCHYAHGAHELRQVSKRHPKYRTEKCKNFELTGKCPFGPRCSYVHPKPDLDLMIEQLTKYLKHTRAPKPEDSDLDCTNNALNIVSSQASSSALTAIPASAANVTRTPLSTNSNANILTPINSSQHNNHRHIYHNHQHAQRQQAISGLILEQTQSAITNENYHSSSSSSSSSSALDEFTSFGTKHKKLRLISNQPSPSSSNLLASNNPFGTSNPLSDFLNKQSNINAISPSQLTPNKRMFVILCVIAGASAHHISNTSKKSINHQLNNHFRTTFIDIILDTSFTESLLTGKLDVGNEVTSTSYNPLTYNVIAEQPETPSSHDFQSYSHRKSSKPEFPSLCRNLTNILSNHHLKFCYKHQELLRTILPQLIHVAKKECVRITKDFRWNCSGFEYLLSKSGTTAQTRESMLVRSILSASMMYLVVKTCSEAKHQSCGCDHRKSIQDSSSPIEFIEDHQGTAFAAAHMQNLNYSDLSNLHAGLSIRLNKSNIRSQGCLANVGFAAAFTRIFIDSDDVFQLNKAHKNLNRAIDSDWRDLAFMKWTRSAINIHNSNLGLQMVRGAIHTRCRCHGISGACQIKSCWDHLPDIDVVTNRLKSAYLYDSTKVEATNFGSFERPDLSLTRIADLIEDSNKKPLVPSMPASSLASESIFSLASFVESDDRPNSDCLVYLNNSPDYCGSQPLMSHPGTRGRTCVPLKDIDLVKVASRISSGINSTRVNQGSRSRYEEAIEEQSVQAIPGSCEQLCCDRGYVSEFVLDMVPSNCRFAFCCQVVCDKCLRQRVQHYCL